MVKLGYAREHKIKPWLFLTPALFWTALVYVYPIIRLLHISTQVFSIEGYVFVGLRNFAYLLRDPIFGTCVRNHVVLLLQVPIIVGAGLVLAVFLYEGVAGADFFRALMLVPLALAIPVIGILFSYVLQLHGLLNTLLENVGLGFLVRDWLANRTTVIPTVLAIVVWRELGFAVVVFYARLMSVREDLYEAAELDGASWLQRLRHVTIPQCRRQVEYLVVIYVINALAWVFGYVFVATKGGPGQSSYVAEYYVYKAYFKWYLPGVAASMALVLLAVTLLIGGARYWFIERGVEVGE